MKTIWNYELDATERQMVEMPGGARILCVQFRDGTPCLFAEVVQPSPLRPRIIETFCTGDAQDDACRNYIGTYYVPGISRAFHVYERTE